MRQIDLTGKRALVTGGSKGIGAATALMLAELGAEVVISARTAPASPVGSSRFIAADLTAPDGPENLATAVLDGGGLDILVDNAGGQVIHGSVEEFTDEDWQHDLQLNLLAPVKLDRALLPALTAAAGAIVHVSSTVARMPEPAVVAYASAKAALAVYSKALSRQVGAQGVRVNAVFPGFTATDMFVGRAEALAAEKGQAYDEFVPDMMKQMGVALGRAGDADEVAETIVFLCSPAASYMTGTQIMVEGGVFPGIF